MRVQFPKWPVWNYQFPERDVKQITRIGYWPKQGGKQTDLDLGAVRLAIGRNGISVAVFKEKHNLPEIADRPDAVAIEYDA